jgi:cytochrome c553
MMVAKLSSASKETLNKWLRGRIAVLLMVNALPAVAAESNSHLRVLAASCAACHGDNGNSASGMPVLAGLDRTHFATQMRVFRSGARPSTVMHHHAKGLTEDEIEQLADHFAVQPRKAARAPMPLNF